MAAEELTRAVLGIDAAWTAKAPSGVALAVEREGRWRLIAAEPSYMHFLALAGAPAPARPAGTLPDASALLAAATTLAGNAPNLVAIDMPLSRTPIVGRRAADNAVSRAYGGRKCGTHSPSAERPGPIADRLAQDFADVGYPLLTEGVARAGLIEVYPHPALVEWTNAAERVPYKYAKTRTYWPGLHLDERRRLLSETWADITKTLESRITGTAAHITASGFTGKAMEDLIDAVICCAVAIDALNGCALAYGDADAAIWIPAVLN